MSEDKKNVYVTLHKDFVRTDIEYVDRATGETRTFNSVTLPKGTVIDGTDVGYYQFSPLFVNPSRFKGEDYRDIPLLANREVWLRKTVMGPDGQPELDEGGRAVSFVQKFYGKSYAEAMTMLMGSNTGPAYPQAKKQEAAPRQSAFPGAFQSSRICFPRTCEYPHWTSAGGTAPAPRRLGLSAPKLSCGCCG